MPNTVVVAAVTYSNPSASPHSCGIALTVFPCCCRNILLHHTCAIAVFVGIALSTLSCIHSLRRYHYVLLRCSSQLLQQPCPALIPALQLRIAVIELPCCCSNPLLHAAKVLNAIDLPALNTAKWWVLC